MVDSGEEDEGSNGDVSGDEGDGFCGGGRHRGEPRVRVGREPDISCCVGGAKMVRDWLEAPQQDGGWSWSNGVGLVVGVRVDEAAFSAPMSTPARWSSRRKMDPAASLNGVRALASLAPHHVL